MSIKLLVAVITFSWTIQPMWDVQAGHVDVTQKETPQATRIVFTSDRAGNEDIYVVNADGSGQVNLTSHPADDSEPAWAPDGQRIAFVSTRNGGQQGNIWVMNANGSEPTRITADNSVADRKPAWSPDGTKIAFLSNRDGEIQVYTMNADGSDLKALTNLETHDGDPSWSPDGGKIAFRSDRERANGGSIEIFVMNTDGTNQTNLTNNPLAHAFGPDWSTDGTKITFYSIPIDATDSNTEIYLMDADGSNQTRLATDPDPDYNPAWSPDGHKIAFDKGPRDGNIEIYAINADGSGQIRLTNNSARDMDPDWQPTTSPPVAIPSLSRWVAIGLAAIFATLVVWQQRRTHARQEL